jgi:hypothetical protein
MAVAILLAPATRVGYMLYPIDFFVWAWLLESEDRRGRGAPELAVDDPQLVCAASPDATTADAAMADAVMTGASGTAG